MSFLTEHHNHIRGRKQEEILDAEQARKVVAHKKAFASVIKFVQEHALEQKQILLLTSLRLMYINDFEENGFPDPNYRREKPSVIT